MHAAPWTLSSSGRPRFLCKTHNVHFAFARRTDSENPILPYIRISFTIRAQFPACNGNGDGRQPSCAAHKNMPRSSGARRLNGTAGNTAIAQTHHEFLGSSISLVRLNVYTTRGEWSALQISLSSLLRHLQSQPAAWQSNNTHTHTHILARAPTEEMRVNKNQNSIILVD